MSESKHTPGPWRIEVNQWGSAIAKDDCCIATTHGQAAITRAELPHEANARLIAAAPDLLASLKEAEELLEQTLHWRGEGWECTETELLGTIRAAIAKAGEP